MSKKVAKVSVSRAFELLCPRSTFEIAFFPQTIEAERFLLSSFPSYSSACRWSTGGLDTLKSHEVHVSSVVGKWTTKIVRTVEK